MSEYDRFRDLAIQPQLSAHERIGFPDGYRAGVAPAILEDIARKLALSSARRGSTLLDLGCGGGELAVEVLRFAQEHGLKLLLSDSPEMLRHLPDGGPSVHKIAGRFPQSVDDISAQAPRGLDFILCYSVFHHLFLDLNRDATGALEVMLGLLAPGGSLLLGDIPNSSMRKRYFESPRGKSEHEHFQATHGPREIEDYTRDQDHMSDETVLALISHARSKGYHAFVTPQARSLPLASRREDILIFKP